MPTTISAKCFPRSAPRIARIAGLSLGLLLAAGLATSASAQATGAPALTSRVRVSNANYHVPDIRMVRDDGKTVQLREELDDGRAVFVNFIFTSCASVCPLSSKVFEDFATALGPERSHVHLVSISIDPEEDTPARLREYAQQFHAGPEWTHYTGTTAASVAAQHAFDAYRGSKMQHTPLTLMRPAPGKPWVRIDGFATADELVRYYHTPPAQP